MTGRKSRAGAVLEVLKMATRELDEAATEPDPRRARERIQLANRMIAEAREKVIRWEQWLG